MGGDSLTLSRCVGPTLVASSWLNTVHTMLTAHFAQFAHVQKLFKEHNIVQPNDAACAAKQPRQLLTAAGFKL